jgi:hypothetical protein
MASWLNRPGRAQRDKIMGKNTLVAGLALALLGATSGQAFADQRDDNDRERRHSESVCYDFFDINIIRLDVKLHSPLTTPKEKREFDHPIQKAYSAHGKAVQPGVVTAAVTGTVDVAQGVGARMGLTFPTLFLFNEFDTLDCTSDEASATPAEWTCLFLFVEEGETFGPDPVTLNRLDPLEDERCSIFTLPGLDALQAEPGSGSWMPEE